MDGYPKRPLTLVLGAPAGVELDLITRRVATFLSKDLGQNVLVENRPAADGVEGAIAVAQSPADGYTIYMATRPLTLQGQASDGPAFKFSEDFVPVVMVARIPYVIVSGMHVWASSLQDTYALMFTRRRIFTCASRGGWSTTHLLCEMLKENGKLSWDHAPYDTEISALDDVTRGGADVAIASLPTALPYIRSEKIRGLAVFARSRVPAIPTLPGIDEHGYVDYQIPDWCGLVAPAGTPANVIARLNQSVNAALADEDVRKDLLRLGYMLPNASNTPEELGKFVTEDVAKWQKILKEQQVTALE
ncbi:tripartite tricarboxylate transporter substrate-binding protein [Bordetella sp. N]|uniref:tripartite tricarboxylate transporter substrate-binding protein n=1 Tax=Bordetella sp. N TaxID=1746199 RepID=UPI0018D205D3|nr:tripartite tricarboxylate transporter substrate-binding protein [Bordetella sp. N]